MRTVLHNDDNDWGNKRFASNKLVFHMFKLIYTLSPQPSSTACFPPQHGFLFWFFFCSGFSLCRFLQVKTENYALNKSIYIVEILCARCLFLSACPFVLFSFAAFAVWWRCTCVSYFIFVLWNCAKLFGAVRCAPTAVNMSFQVCAHWEWVDKSHVSVYGTSIGEAPMYLMQIVLNRMSKMRGAHSPPKAWPFSVHRHWWFAVACIRLFMHMRMPDCCYSF